MRFHRVYGCAATAYWVVLAGSTVTSGAVAQVQRCANPTQVFMGTAGEQIIGVDTPITLTLVDSSGAEVTGSNAMTRSAMNGRWKPAADDSTKASAVLQDQGMVRIKRAQQPDCLAAIELAASPAPPPPPASEPDTGTGTVTPTAALANYEKCRLAGQAKETETRLQTRGGRRGRPLVVLFYDDPTNLNSTPCYVSTSTAAVGDLIVVGVYYDPNTRVWNQVQHEPCPLESASPNILQSESKQVQAPQAALPEFVTIWFMPRRCFTQSLVVSVTGRALEQSGADPSELKRSYPIEQYQRYRATIQTGVLFSPLQQPEFGVRTNTAGETVIFNKGPDDRGPEYMAAIVLYGLPRYFRDLAGGGHYSGRDPVNETNLLDRIGAVLGVGLENPGKSFMVGVAVEALAGVNGIGVLQFRRIDRLAAGVAVDQPFSGTEDEIPLHADWEDDWVFGLSLDLRYVTQLFGSRP